MVKLFFRLKICKNMTVNILKIASKVYSNSTYNKLANEVDVPTYNSFLGQLTL